MVLKKAQLFCNFTDFVSLTEVGILKYVLLIATSQLPTASKIFVTNNGTFRFVVDRLCSLSKTIRILYTQFRISLPNYLFESVFIQNGIVWRRLVLIPLSASNCKDFVLDGFTFQSLKWISVSSLHSVIALTSSNKSEICMYGTI